MGQGGSVEQKQNLKEILSWPLSSQKQQNAIISPVLELFCELFPLTIDSKENEEDVDVKEKKLLEVFHFYLDVHVHGTPTDETNQDLVLRLLECFKRIVKWKELYKLIPKYSLKPLFTCLEFNNQISLKSLELLELIFHRPWGDVDAAAEKRTNDKIESLVKTSCFHKTNGVECLVALLCKHCHSKEVDVSDEVTCILLQLLSIFQLLLVKCKHTTDQDILKKIVDALCTSRVELMELCRHPNTALRLLACDTIKEVFFLANSSQIFELQEAARNYGALLWMLSCTLQKKGDSDVCKKMTDRSIELVELFCVGNKQTKKLMLRVFPVDLFLKSEKIIKLGGRNKEVFNIEANDSQQESLNSQGPGSNSKVRSTGKVNNIAGNQSLQQYVNDQKQKKKKKKDSFISFDFDLETYIEDAKKRLGSSTTSTNKNCLQLYFRNTLEEARQHGERWDLIVNSAFRIHEYPHLIWREAMLKELQVALALEIERFDDSRRENCSVLAKWPNVDVFVVDYESLQAELYVYGYYLKYLVPSLANLCNDFEVEEPVLFGMHLLDFFHYLALSLFYKNDHSPTNLLKKLRTVVKVLRLLCRRYAMVFSGQVPIQFFLSILQQLNNCQNSSNVLLLKIELLKLFNTLITTSLNTKVIDLFRQHNGFAVVSRCFCLSRTLSQQDPATNGGVVVEEVDGVILEDEEEEGVVIDEDDEIVKSMNNPYEVLVYNGLSFILESIRRGCYMRLHYSSSSSSVSTILTMLQVFLQHPLPPVVLNQLHTLLFKHIFIDDTAKEKLAQYRYWPLCIYAITCSNLTTEIATIWSMYHSLDTDNGKSGTIDSDNECKFMSSDIDDCCPCQRSALSGLLPRSMIHYFLSSPIEEFVSLFNHQLSNSYVDVKWEYKDRLACKNQLAEIYQNYTGPNPTPTQTSGSYINIKPSRINYKTKLCIGGLYLHEYTEGKTSSFALKWSTENLLALMQELFVHLRMYLKRKSVFGININVQEDELDGDEVEDDPLTCQVMILKSILKLLTEQQLKNHYECSSDNGSLELLLAPLQRSLLTHIDQRRAILSLDILTVLLSSNKSDRCCEAIGKSNFLPQLSDAIEKLFANDPFLASTEKKIEESNEESESELPKQLLMKLTNLVSLMATHCPQYLVRRKSNKILEMFLLTISSLSNITAYPSFCVIALSCLTKLAALQQPMLTNFLFLEHGGLIYLTSLICLTTSSIPSAVYTAVAGVLQACSDRHKNEDADLVQKVLYQLFTPSLSVKLQSSTEFFMQAVLSEHSIISPTLIWTDSMKKILLNCIEIEKNKLVAARSSNIFPRWDPNNFLAADSYCYQYPELANEIVVDYIYVRIFVEFDEDKKIEGINLMRFRDNLLISIKSSEEVIEVLKKQHRDAAVKAQIKELEMKQKALQQVQYIIQPESTINVSSKGRSDADSEICLDEGDDEDDMNLDMSV